VRSDILPRVLEKGLTRSKKFDIQNQMDVITESSVGRFMEIGEKVKTLRRANRVTLNELSEKSGVSKSLLSQIERSISVPTVTTLQKIADAFDIPISRMFSEDSDGAPAEGLNRADAKAGSPIVVRKGRRKKLVMPWGAWQEILCPDLRHKIEFIFLHYPVGTRVEEFYTHQGEECGVVLQGAFKGIIGDQEIILEAGDSIYFDSSIPHRWENAGDTEVMAIWAITPPSF
jgi:transcriptional regulator with XRE-family HTH domain